jgi:hypothetical protein
MCAGRRMHNRHQSGAPPARPARTQPLAGRMGKSQSDHCPPSMTSATPKGFGLQRRFPRASLRREDTRLRYLR